jgi:hypothetical protein
MKLKLFLKFINNNLKKNKIYIILFIIFFIILIYYLIKKSILKNLILIENFTEKSINDFLNIQTTINKNKIFDIEILSKQVSQNDLDYFNKYGMWKWNEKVIELYKEALSNNPYIKVDKDDAVNYARSIYNEKAILQILSQQTKEGQFLLNGILLKKGDINKYENLPSGFGDFPYDVDLIEDKRDDIIKCNLSNDKNPTLERITYKGRDNILQYQEKKIEELDYNNLENLISGFKFLNKPCNPCIAFKEKPDYSCPFELNLRDNNYGISPIMKYLWGI